MNYFFPTKIKIKQNANLFRMFKDLTCSSLSLVFPLSNIIKSWVGFETCFSPTYNSYLLIKIELSLVLKEGS